MTDFNEDEISEPPVYRSLYHGEIEAFRDHQLLLNHISHNQEVERHVKFVTEVPLFLPVLKKETEVSDKKSDPGS